MQQIALIQHAGSGNHGCEAIVDTVVRMLPEQQFILVTNSKAEDEKYLPSVVKERVDIEEEQHIADHVLTHTLLYAYRKVSHDRESFLRYRFRPITGQDKPALAIGIGGDNYCYDYMVDDLILTDSMLHRQGTKTVLLGCSIEPSLLKNPRILEDLQSYEKITARESITYEAMLSAGISREKVHLCPDPAFTLPVDGRNLPPFLAKETGHMKETGISNAASEEENEDEENNAPSSADVVGINLSPLVENYAEDKTIALRSFSALIQHILDTTDSTVALIPHVVWERSNDLLPLQKLYRQFESTGRVYLIPDQPAEQLKAVIGRCRLFIGARTHATIAAYSTCVPTLVLGYSVKARGIARDLFGTDEHYVLPIQNLTDPQQLIQAYGWLAANESSIRQHLQKVIPDIIIRAQENAETVRSVANKLG